MQEVKYHFVIYKIEKGLGKACTVQCKNDGPPFVCIQGNQSAFLVRDLLHHYTHFLQYLLSNSSMFKMLQTLLIFTLHIKVSFASTPALLFYQYAIADIIRCSLL